jgi:hypothetical protein
MILDRVLLLVVLGMSVSHCQSGAGQQAKEMSGGDRAELERLKANEANRKLKTELAQAKANEITAEERAVLERAKAREASRNALATAPGSLISAAKPNKKERGLVNTYTKVTSIEFSNNSPFDVSDITGYVKFTASNGSEIGRVPFTASGDVNAGATQTLEVTSGEVTGKAEDIEVAVESVHIRG